MSMAQVAPAAGVPMVTPGAMAECPFVLTYCMHEAKGLAVLFDPVQTFSEACGALCVCQNSPGSCFPGSVGRSRDVLVAELGNSTLKGPYIVPGSCLLGPSKAYTTQWSMLTHW